MFGLNARTGAGRKLGLTIVLAKKKNTLQLKCTCPGLRFFFPLPIQTTTQARQVRLSCSSIHVDGICRRKTVGMPLSSPWI